MNVNSYCIKWYCLLTDIYITVNCHVLLTQIESEELQEFEILEQFADDNASFLSNVSVVNKVLSEEKVIKMYMLQYCGKSTRSAHTKLVLELCYYYIAHFESLNYILECNDLSFMIYLNLLTFCFTSISESEVIFQVNCQKMVERTYIDLVTYLWQLIFCLFWQIIFCLFLADM